MNNNKDKKKRRFETLPEDHHTRQLPFANAYLIECFNLIGRFSSSGMGMAPLSWGEIESFSNQSSCALDNWEADIIYRMSCEYCSMHSKSDGESVNAPYSIDIRNNKDELQKMRDRIDKQLEGLFK